MPKGFGFGHCLSKAIDLLLSLPCGGSFLGHVLVQRECPFSDRLAAAT
jgi:hypothetical protein